MVADTLESKAHELIGQLNPDKLAAVVHLLEVMIDDEEELTDEDRAAIRAGLDSLEKNGTVSMEEVLSDFGLTMADFQKITAETDSDLLNKRDG
jgi:hypothetical protein